MGLIVRRVTGALDQAAFAQGVRLLQKIGGSGQQDTGDAEAALADALMAEQRLSEEVGGA